MNKKIAFLSELPFDGKVERTHNHMRTEFAQMCALQADHYCFYNLIPNKFQLPRKYDHVILLISKSDKLREALFAFDLVDILRPYAAKIWFMQEATAQIYQTKTLAQQVWHYNLLQDVDGVLCENNTDIPYFKGLVQRSIPIHSIPTLIITDKHESYRDVPKEDKAMVGGNCTAWYGGFDSYITATHFKVPIFVPHMRNVADEGEMMTVLPHMTFDDWMKTLSTFKYAVHLMPNITAGTFALNCAYFGIPCIGYKESDTQRVCHPSLSIEKFDLDLAISLAKTLKRDEEFYKDCSLMAKQRFDKYFAENIFIEKMKVIFNAI